MTDHDTSITNSGQRHQAFLYSGGLLTTVKLNVLFQSLVRVITKFASGGTDTVKGKTLPTHENLITKPGKTFFRLFSLLKHCDIFSAVVGLFEHVS